MRARKACGRRRISASRADAHRPRTGSALLASRDPTIGLDAGTTSGYPRNRAPFPLYLVLYCARIVRHLMLSGELEFALGRARLTPTPAELSIPAAPPAGRASPKPTQLLFKFTCDAHLIISDLRDFYPG